MTVTSLDRAHAAANLLNLGMAPDRVREQANRWSARQAAARLDAIEATIAAEPVADELGPLDPAHLFVASHYSLYPLLYRALAERAPERTVYSLVGSQSAANRAALQGLAERYGCRIVFVESSPAMVREMRAAIASGHPGVMLLDIPWSPTRANLDRRYPAAGGAFLGRTTTLKLIEAIDPQYRFLSCERTGQRHFLTCPAYDGIGAAFAALGEALVREPADYERLHQFHQFFAFDRPSRTAVSFATGGQRYLLEPASMRTWTVASHPLISATAASATGVSRDAALLAALGTVTGTQTDALLAF